MAANQQAYRQVMRRYDTDRQAARARLEERRELLYKTLPEVQTVDHVVQTHMLAMIRAILDGDAESVAQLRQKTEKLNAKKAAMLKNAGIADNYFTDVFACQTCQDTGYIDGAAKCRCMTQKLTEIYYNQANLEQAIKNENFDEFDIRYYSKNTWESAGISPYQNIQTIYSACMDFVATFDRKAQNLLFYGEAGLGKTFLCNCIANDLLKNGRSVLYVTAPRFFKKIGDSYFNRDESGGVCDEQLNMIYDVDALIIDDLGSEMQTLITSSELFNIINSRILDKKHTIISTNLSPAGLQEQYTDRIFSRFLGEYKMMEFFGDDIRFQKKLGRRQ